MAIKVLDRGNGKGSNCITSFLIDTADDKDNLPTETSTGTCGEYCSAGSHALIADSKEVLVLNTQGEWV